MTLTEIVHVATLIDTTPDNELINQSINIVFFNNVAC